MTGYGRGAAELAGQALVVELQSFNRRALELNCSLPREWQGLERQISERLRAVLHRGAVRVTVQFGAAGGGTDLNLDRQAIAHSMRQLDDLAHELEIRWEPDAELLLRLAVLHRQEGRLPPSELAEPALTAALGEASDALLAMRRAEGEALRTDLLRRAERLGEMVAAIRSAAGDATARYRELLFARLQQAGLELDLNDERVLREIALFADRCDISEELTRLESHLGQFRDSGAQASGDEPVGRKLEFIVQEIHRETNTIGAKASLVEISRLVIEAKNEIERMREQLQNIE